MTTQAERAHAFAALHVKGDPVILYNAWDAGSAKVVAAAGAKAIATGSWSVAAAWGYGDGEKVPLDVALMNLARIVAVVDLPVTLDFESGYARAPADVQRNAATAIEAGAIGFNFEDQIVGGEGLYPIAEQQARIRAVRAAADAAKVPVYINARCDHFLKEPAEKHGEFVDRAIERGRAYAQAGASGYFVPGLANPDLIRKVCSSVELPVNLMMFQGMPSAKELAALGVARLSYGPGPYRLAMRALEAAAKEVYAS